jgi:lipoate-protein ligase A
MAQQWRLVLDGQRDGVWNMAVDRAIQLVHSEGSAPPTLRLYGWRAATVSLGRFQRAEPDLVDRCWRSGVGIVRRPTGGRGVLHDDEVTYSIVAGARDGLPRGVSDSYRYLCAGVIDAYVQLGVGAELATRKRGTRHDAACYLHATTADVSVGSAKLAGSAQVWQGETCLQHGSFTRTRDIERESYVFGLDRAESIRLEETTATLDDLLGRAPDISTVRDGVAAGFSRALGVSMLEGELEEAEVEIARTLLGEYEVE